MKRVVLLVSMMVAVGCECGPAVACSEDTDCPSWGRCVKEAGASRGSCVLATVAADAGVDAGTDAGTDAGVDAGAAFASISPLSLELAQAGCGVATTDVVTVSNTGTAALSVSASTGTSPLFSVSPSSGAVAPGQSLTFTVSATVPATTMAGTEFQGRLTFTTNDAMGAHELALTARASGVTLTLTPSVASFGVLPVNTTASRLPLTLTNAGNVTATLTVVDPADAQFSVQWPGRPATVTLAPGASLTGLEAGFSPTKTTPSSSSAELRVTQPLCGASVANIPMTGQGTNGGVGLSTTDVFFGANGRVNCGAVAASQTFTLSNTGNQAFAWAGTLSKGTNSPFSFSPTSGTVPASNGSVVITVSTTAIPAQALTSLDAFGDILTIVTDVANDVSHPINLHQTANGAILSFAPGTVEFGQVPVNNTATAPFAVINEGNTSPAITLTTDNAAFTLNPAGALVAPGSSSTALTGTFAPGTSVAAESALVALSLDAGEPLCAPLPAPLTMTGQGTMGSVSYSPVALDFGAVNCGATPVAKTVTFRNNGNQAYTVTPSLGRDAGSPYVVTMTPASGVVVTDGGTLVITVAPNPIPQTSAVTPNLYGDTLTVTTDVQSDSPRNIPLRLTARGSVFAISSSSINFGSVTVGATANGQFTVSNSGNAPGALVFSPIAPQVFGLPANALVNAGSSSIESATFSPAMQTTYSDMATVAKTAATVLCQPLPFTSLALAGIGTGGNVVAVSATSLNFGLVPCGTTAAARTVTVTNNSSNQLALAYALAGGAASAYLVSGPASIAAQTMGTVTITPKQVPATSSTVADAFADTLTITASGGPVNETHTVALHETAQGAVLTLNPGSLSFSGNGSKNFTVNNAGNLAAAYTLTLGGTDPERFSVSPTSATATGGSSVAEAVTYTRPVVWLGATYTAGVTLSSSAGLCAPLPGTLPLSGT
ncbi:MAG: choice-of-anchor D domain-containing protein [Archangium sp.]|nr:choice-of-anchor D domain-containing protein [Archangium sp.]MDP3571758.1 choice-of-anchor D domain-containing protein [Archangium sp.]